MQCLLHSGWRIIFTVLVAFHFKSTIVLLHQFKTTFKSLTEELFKSILMQMWSTGQVSCEKIKIEMFVLLR